MRRAVVRRAALGLGPRSGGAAEDGLLEPLDSSAQVVTSTAGQRRTCHYNWLLALIDFSFGAVQAPCQVKSVGANRRSH